MGRGKSTIKAIKLWDKKEKKKKKEIQTELVRKKEDSSLTTWVAPARGGRGDHHCPEGHAFEEHCVTAQHCGLCPACFRIFSWRAGCNLHGYKGEQLLSKVPANPAALANKYRRMGVLGEWNAVKNNFAAEMFVLIGFEIFYKSEAEQDEDSVWVLVVAAA